MVGFWLERREVYPRTWFQSMRLQAPAFESSSKLKHSPVHNIDSLLLSDISNALQNVITGQVCFDQTTRILYSTDASVYQIQPLGVVFPRSLDELNACVEIAAGYHVPILARGAGSSLAGQAIGPALIVDCSRYLYKQVDINPEESTATVEPGVILASLNRVAASHGLQFGPDPASAERATMGGTLANNATGAHSIWYGMCADHLISSEVILADGSTALFEEVSLELARSRAQKNGIEAAIYRAALDIRTNYAEAIRQKWPRTWRRASGYNLNYLVPWSSSQPPFWSEPESGNSFPFYPPIAPNTLNLASLVAGSEGTLAIIRRAKVRLVPLPRYTILAVLPYSSISQACDSVPSLLIHKPSAIELIPANMVALARSVPAYASQLSFLEQMIGSHGEVPALLVVEFSGNDRNLLEIKARALDGVAVTVDSPAIQKQVWGVRKVGLGILLSTPGDRKPVAFIEDLAVPVERLGEFVREMERIFHEHNTKGDFYAHASAGCLHVRPLLNLKRPKDINSLRSIANAAVELVIGLGGSASGEHGDGLARSEWLKSMFGPQMMQSFRDLKQAADPEGLLNPGKIVDAQAMDQNLRFGPSYRTSTWTPVMDFTSQGGFSGAVEMCNGAGICRKAEGVMCPSFQAVKDEMHSTRGRANLLRAFISGNMPSTFQSWETLFQALDLCMACKGCKAECPSAVDMAKLKYEFLQHYYRSLPGKRHPLRDYLFAYIGKLAYFGHAFTPIVNKSLAGLQYIGAGERLMGLSRNRRFPELRRRIRGKTVLRDHLEENGVFTETVLFLPDAFNRYFQPEVEQAALNILGAAGCRVIGLPIIGAGRTLISKGFLKQARTHAQKVVDIIAQTDRSGVLPVIGLEPSEIYTLKDEYRDLLPGNVQVLRLTERTFMIDEFLIRPGEDKNNRIFRIVDQIHGQTHPVEQVLLHGHCYQKAQPPHVDGYPIGVSATSATLEGMGYQVNVIEGGCCGMAGAFGYEAEHYAVSMQIGEIALFPAVRRANENVLISACGTSCQTQIKDGTGKEAFHPVLLMEKILQAQYAKQ